MKDRNGFDANADDERTDTYRRTVLVGAGTALTGTLAGCLGFTGDGGDGGGSGDDSDGGGTGGDDDSDGGDSGDDSDGGDSGPRPGEYDGWPMFGHDPWRTGYAPGTTGPSGSMAEAWSFESDSDIKSSPVVVDVAATDESSSETAEGLTVFLGGKDENLYAFDAETGDEQWVTRIENESYSYGDATSINASPAFADGTLFAADTNGTVVALDPATAEEQWRYEIIDGGVSTPLVVADGRLLVVDGGNNAVHALNTESGDEEWTAGFDGRLETAPAVDVGSADGSTVFVGDEDGMMTALDLATGDEQWSVETEGVHVSPAAADGAVVCAHNYTAYALDPGTGEEMWSMEVQVPAVSPAVVDGAVVFAEEKDFAHWVRKVDVETGDQQWRTEFDANDFGLTAPAVADGTVYVGTSEKDVKAIDLESGDEIARFEGDQPFSGESSPAVVDGHLYLADGENTLHAITGS